MATTAIPAGPPSTKRAVFNTIRGSLGNLVEWYDVYVYTVFASYLQSSFFADGEPNAGIYTMGIFAITFVMRPIGSWFFGRYADRHGRRPALVFSISLMAGASLLIALTPTAESIGSAAVVMLVLCRLLQGFATGGEYGTSATYMSEAATPGLRGFFSSFQYVTLVGGHVLAQVTLLIQQSVLTDEQIASFGWRIAFGIGAVGAVVVLFLRRSMDESLQTDVDGKRSGSMTELFTAYPKQLLICFLVTLGGTVAFYTYSVNGPLIVKSTYADQGMTATWINLAALVLLMVIQPLGGLLSDKIGRKPLLVGFGIAGVLWSWTFLNLLPRVETPMVSFLLLAGTYVILTGYTSINAIVKAELFPAHVRALGLGLGYALANSMFGGTAPVIYEAAKENNALDAFGIYVTIAIGVSLVVYVFVLKNRAPTFLDAEQARRADANTATVS
ncbi:MFS transporter [Rhodococcus sp. BP-349]|uniref:MFS transporter n=1 Tax=unclassified Rhodococcus (in: high G+C Gram-positive bacteria) TaxID=192944 RepID=UPI001C9B1569|nr:MULTISPECIES: MFS transporter [unclassified Rhodococcus (in: high G+C Gram-positive bacteria)]MBY6538355.1 MFS transporter [Rhodococcus sp. BP-363]MBY6542692.1 MFS transporter [Rhodococcus sp. BP-369]MBY6561922.1 MFS transporter [Rhodococcus sp. BP-370]MBY6576214.1 MFS transporter [Rhodococcus sp. BP-364]MBY6585515.1 MFS transporter [Rhodococcus sp. BP-358]